MPHNFNIGTVGSCMDSLYEMIVQRQLPVWDSVRARMQTAGKGQMHRHWISIEGNIFGAIYLPCVEPFNSSAGAIAIGALCCQALNGMGFPVKLKWPNDLIVFIKGVYYKVGGILLEERAHILIAGIGINIVGAPAGTEFDSPSPIPAGYLEELKSNLDADAIWKEMVEKIYIEYNQLPAFAMRWRKFAENLLAWVGCEVTWTDGSDSERGLFTGISDTGAALLKTGDKIEEFTSGNIRPVA